MMTTAETVRAARRVSAPQLGISTADQWATIEALRVDFEKTGPNPPMLHWDCARGFLAVNKPGEAALKAIMPPESFPGVTPGLNLVEALNMAANLPERSILFILNAQMFWDEPGVIQGTMNLRELFKQNQRTLIYLAPALRLPVTLQQDIMTIDEPLPVEAEIRRIIIGEIGHARESKKTIPEPEPELLQRATEALTGLAGFSVEQSVAFSLGSTERLDLDQLWARKRAFVQQTRGLMFDTGTETLADLGGLEQAKRHVAEIFGGRDAPRAILRIDEIEKALAGATGVGDSSGTSQDALGVILREMEDNGWAGMIAVGPPGAGKSFLSKTMGRTHSVPSLELDLGATKGSLVGQSEDQIRTAMKVVKAIAGAGCYVVSTCNRLDAIPAELRRRFTDGIWFFDLPDADERRPIWTVNLTRYQLEGEDLETLVAMSDTWTGAEIRNVCRRAYRTQKPIAEAAAFTIPVAKSDPDSIEKLRKLAAGKFLSASYPGTYKHPLDGVASATTIAARKFMEA